jgi:signal transduction histidine kinase
MTRRGGSAPGRAEGSSSSTDFLLRVIALQADASATAMIAGSAAGVLLAHNERFASMWDVPRHVLAAGRVGTIALYLKGLAAADALAVADLLAEPPPAGAAGEIVSTGGRTVTWSTSETSCGGARVWTFRDVTRERQLAAALRDAGNWLRMLEVHTRGVVLEIDADARIVGIWGRSSEYFEQPDAVLQGKDFVAVLGQAEGAAFDARIRRVLATGRPESFEYTLELRGHRRVFDANAEFLPSDGGEVPRVTVIIRDVTERAHMQAKLLQTERLASVGLLAAGVAHEINNPVAYTLLNLHHIQSGLAKLASARPDAALDDLLDAVGMSLEGTQRVQEIVQDLRRFSRSDPGGEGGAPVDVHRVLEFAIDMAAPEVGSRAKIVRDFGAVPAVVASEGRLCQVFLNLIVNAAQAIPRGAADRNEIRLVTRTDERRRAVIEVHDTGEGMPPAVMHRLFEPFYTTKAPGVGTGLGLSICHGITTSLGGEIAVESEEGRGSVFRVLLPAAGGPADDVAGAKR